MFLDRDNTHQRLAQLLRWLAPTIIGFAIAYAAMGVYFHDWPTMGSALSIGMHGLLTMVGQARLRRGRQYQAAYLVGGGAVVSMLIVTALQPALYTSLAVVPVLIAAVFLQYTRPQHVRYYLVGCCAGTLLVVFLGEVMPKTTQLPELVLSMLRLSSLMAIVVFALIMLGEFSSRLQAMLARLGSAYTRLEAQHKELARLNYQHELILNSAGEGIYGVDTQGIVTFMNPAAAHMFGGEAAELISRPIHTYVQPVRSHEAASPINPPPVFAVLQDGVVKQSADEVFWCKDGTYFPVEYVSTPIREDGAITGAVIIFRDITERVQAHAALEAERLLLAQRVEERTADLSAANAELARAARLKDEFLASMSHELRTPLNAILGLSEALEEGTYEPLTAPQLKTIRVIEQSGQHLLALINDILDLAKVEAGKIELEYASLELSKVCQASLQFTKQLALKKRITVSTTLDPLVTHIYADERRLKQILVNLLSNAVKFTAEGGTVGLAVTGDREQQVVRLTVWDTGIGIAKEDMARLFRPFVQLDSRLARQYEGTGLGLALVARMVELHGGGVTVESTVGQGSQFTVSLPWHEPPAAGDGPAGDTAQIALTRHALVPKGAAAQTLPSPAPAPKAVAQPVVLLVEDNEANITTLVDYLQIKGYRVVVARNGVEALARAREVGPDVLLMDIQMPEMDGLEATRLLRADPQLAAIPVIAVTAFAMPGDRERCLGAGANDYMSKPFSLKALVDGIETLLTKGYSHHI